jgi:hypothetical protein
VYTYKIDEKTIRISSHKKIRISIFLIFISKLPTCPTISYTFSIDVVILNFYRWDIHRVGVDTQ